MLFNIHFECAHFECTELKLVLHCHFPQEVVDVTVKGLLCLSTYEAVLGALVLTQLQVRLTDTTSV